MFLKSNGSDTKILLKPAVSGKALGKALGIGSIIPLPPKKFTLSVSISKSTGKRNP